MPRRTTILICSTWALLGFTCGEHQKILTTCLAGDSALEDQRALLIKGTNGIDVENAYKWVYQPTHHCDRPNAWTHGRALQECHGAFTTAWTAWVDLLQADPDEARRQFALWAHIQADWYSHSSADGLTEAQRADLEACWEADSKCDQAGLLHLPVKVTAWDMWSSPHGKPKGDDFPHKTEAKHLLAGGSATDRASAIEAAERSCQGALAAGKARCVERYGPEDCERYWPMKRAAPGGGDRAR